MLKGSKTTPKHREKISKTLLGKETTKEARLKMRKAKLGKKFTTQHKAKISDSRRNWQNKQPVIEGTSYGYLHRRVNMVRGTPKECEHCNTKTATRYVWASPNHTQKEYEDPASYIRLCVKCHGEFDKPGNVSARLREKIEELEKEIAGLRGGEIT